MKYCSLILFIIPTLAAANSNGSKNKIKVEIEHLKHDFMDIFGTWADIFSEKEIDFRYFEAHDYDKNQKLDGLELLVALTHEQNHSENESEAHNPQEIERQIDDMFTDHDGNNDGYLDYKEFLSVQRTLPDAKDMKLTEL